MEVALLYMIWLRILSGSLDIFAAFTMYKLGDLEKAFVVNTSLALIGPIIFIVTTGIGLAGMQDKVSLPKMFCLFSGVLLIFISLRMK
ncbi:YqhV family protein [Bacillus ndiopicus]|uniref:YqhV family protein n=1 Tax=Bacillus ndiopicus TaxID=1347368 RepID=UPI000A661A2B|nr:YqhV family protein [Bacillus ndiopicus]